MLFGVYIYMNSYEFLYSSKFDDGFINTNAIVSLIFLLIYHHQFINNQQIEQDDMVYIGKNIM